MPLPGGGVLGVAAELLFTGAAALADEGGVEAGAGAAVELVSAAVDVAFLLRFFFVDFDDESDALVGVSCLKAAGKTTAEDTNNADTSKRNGLFNLLRSIVVLSIRDISCYRQLGKTFVIFSILVSFGVS